MWGENLEPKSSPPDPAQALLSNFWGQSPMSLGPKKSEARWRCSSDSQSTSIYLALRGPGNCSFTHPHPSIPSLAIKETWVGAKLVPCQSFSNPPIHLVSSSLIDSMNIFWASAILNHMKLPYLPDCDYKQQFDIVQSNTLCHPHLHALAQWNNILF